MNYIPRLECPSRSSRFYNSNENPFVASGYGMFQNNGNCTCYAFGRFFEILGKQPKLSSGNAGRWYGNTADGYERGSSPQLGAVACWSNPGKAGHVAIVEKINSDGSVLMSQSGWHSGYFWTQTHHPTNYLGGSYIFQGFIYNPAVKGMKDKLSEFLQVAQLHLGEGGDWTWKVSGLSKGQPWCAAFINAVAKTVGGVLNVCLPNTYVAGDYARLGVLQNFGKFLEGPYYGISVNPQPGDLILFRWSKSSRSDQYASDHIGIVLECKDDIIYTVEGNSGNKVSKRQYGKNNSCINGYFRPNWNAAGGNVTNLVSYRPLYQEFNTREDAILREVGYINKDYEPSINLSNIKLSLLNYTTPLGTIFSGSTKDSSSYDTVITDNMEANPRNVIKYFMDKGLNAAAGCGIAGNIWHESRFNTASIGDNGTSFGICQWHLGRGAAMKKMAGSNWASNLTGQLNYLYYELTTSYTSVYNVLTSVPNNESGARKAADVFVRKFEVPANVNYQSSIRQDTASKYWKQLAIQLV